MKNAIIPLTLVVLLVGAVVSFAVERNQPTGTQADINAPAQGETSSAALPPASSTPPLTNTGTRLSLSQQPTSEGWDVYRNPWHHYSINYPTSANLEATSSVDGGYDQWNEPQLQAFTVTFTQPFTNSGGGSGSDEFTFTVTVYDNHKLLTARQWSERFAAYMQGQAVTINGLKGWQAHSVGPGGDYIYLDFIRGNADYEIVYGDPSYVITDVSSQPEYTEMFGEMLQSFSVQ